MISHKLMYNFFMITVNIFMIIINFLYHLQRWILFFPILAIIMFLISTYFLIINGE